MLSDVFLPWLSLAQCKQQPPLRIDMTLAQNKVDVAKSHCAKEKKTKKARCGTCRTCQNPKWKKACLGVADAERQRCDQKNHEESATTKDTIIATGGSK